MDTNSTIFLVLPHESFLNSAFAVSVELAIQSYSLSHPTLFIINPGLKTLANGELTMQEISELQQMGG
jgi:hypothetical protein